MAEGFDVIINAEEQAGGESWGRALIGLGFILVSDWGVKYMTAKAGFSLIGVCLVLITEKSMKPPIGHVSGREIIANRSHLTNEANNCSPSKSCPLRE